MCSYRLNGQYLLRILKELLLEYLDYSELDNMSGFRTFFFFRKNYRCKWTDADFTHPNVFSMANYIAVTWYLSLK